MEQNAEERPECNDGLDNDYDGYIDFSSDLGCSGLEDDDESTPYCGNGIIESGENCEQNSDCIEGKTCQGCMCVLIPG